MQVRRYAEKVHPSEAASDHWEQGQCWESSCGKLQCWLIHLGHWADSSFYPPTRQGMTRFLFLFDFRMASTQGSYPVTSYSLKWTKLRWSLMKSMLSLMSTKMRLTDSTSTLSPSRKPSSRTRPLPKLRKFQGLTLKALSCLGPMTLRSSLCIFRRPSSRQMMIKTLMRSFKARIIWSTLRVQSNLMKLQRQATLLAWWKRRRCQAWTLAWLDQRFITTNIMENSQEWVPTIATAKLTKHRIAL